MNKVFECFIFDMDGVIVDNSECIIKSWAVFLEKYGKKLPEEQIGHWIYGRTNKETIRHFFGEDIEETEVLKLAEEKELIYRNMYEKEIRPVNGLIGFLEHIRKENFKIGLASSAPKSNVDFILDRLGIRSFFDSILDGTLISKGKPDPEVYLLSAKLLCVSHDKCIAFEDSIPGIQSAKRAGMNVIGLATTHKEDELKIADSIIKDFQGLFAGTIIQRLSRYTKI